MSIVLAVVTTLFICGVSAVLEGVMAGGNVREYYARLRQPRYAVSLPAWYVIGALYYVICAVVLYRLLRHPEETDIGTLALVLIVMLMAANAIWNFIFFRARNLRWSFLSFGPYIVITIALIITLSRLDQIATGLVFVYLLYLMYALAWSYRLWSLNQ